MGEDPKPEATESAPAPAPRFPPGTQFGRYRIVREIGTGGMGSVYEAVLVDLNKRVALKVLAAELTHKDEYRAALRARSARRGAHPPPERGRDLRRRRARRACRSSRWSTWSAPTCARASIRGRCRTRELIDLMIPVIAAVVTAHDVKVIHRDIKPENIFLNEQPGQGLQPVVLDFGISKVLDEDGSLNNLTATSSMMGTPLYMSPEQVRGSREVDPRTDQYALAVLLYEGLTAASAFTGNSVFDLLIKKTEGEFTPLRNHKADLPAALCSAIERAMAADRDHRFPSLRAFAQPLLAFASDHTRSLWAAALSPSAAPEPIARDADRRRAQRQHPAQQRQGGASVCGVAPRGFRAWHAGLALLAIGFAGFALARMAAPDKPQRERRRARAPARLACGWAGGRGGQGAAERVHAARDGRACEARFTLDGEACRERDVGPRAPEGREAAHARAERGGIRDEARDLHGRGCTE